MTFVRKNFREKSRKNLSGKTPLHLPKICLPYQWLRHSDLILPALQCFRFCSHSIVASQWIADPDFTVHAFRTAMKLTVRVARLAF